VDRATMRKTCSIVSVTVAHNGVSVLRQHLQALALQTRKLDEIVVVDNASTDGTQRLLAREFPEITTLHQQENGGIGGGLAAGLAYALGRKHDWVWIFDQDSLPAQDALEHLLNGLPHLHADAEITAILAPSCAHPETGIAYPALQWSRWRFVPIRNNPDQPAVFVDLVISSGSLMRSEAVAKVGLPRQDFFMDFVDYEHCLRLRRQGYRIAVIRDSNLDHAIGTPTVLNIFGWAKSWTDHAPWREYYMTRNEIFTMWRYYPELAAKAFVFYRLARHAVAVLLFGQRKRSCLQMMYRGVSDGRAGRLGIRHFAAAGQPAPAEEVLIAK
jgi:GT2 family glycosyltransferase